EYLAGLDADDLCMPERLEKQVGFLDTHPEIALLGTAARFFDSKGLSFVAVQPQDHEAIACELFFGYTMFHPTVMFRKSAFQEAGLGYDPYFRQSQDHDLWVRASRKLKFANLPVPLVEIRKHAGQIGARLNDSQRRYSREILERQVNELEVQLSPDDIELLSARESESLLWEKRELERYEQVLLDLIAANASIQLFEPAAFRSAARDRFLEHCRNQLAHKNASGVRVFRSSLIHWSDPGGRRLLALLARASLAVADSLLRRLASRIQRYGRYLSDLDWYELIFSLREARLLSQPGLERKTCLIVEPNSFHGEVLPGICHYLDELGYDIFLVMRRKNQLDEALCRVSSRGALRTFVIAPPVFRLFAGSLDLARFDAVMVTSITYAERHGYYGSFYQYMNNRLKVCRNLLGLEHHVYRPVTFRELANYRKIFTISGYSSADLDLPMLNPHYFGEVSVKQVRGAPVRFLAVGQALQSQRSFDLLHASISRLRDRGYEDFEVNLVGRDTGAWQFDSLGQLKVLGYLDFEEFYALLETVDFVLPLLDPGVPRHQRYLSGETTGTRQLVLGFQRIPVVHRSFARAYGWNEDNAVLYADEDLDIAMEAALNLSDERYNQMLRSLADHAMDIEKQSLANLEQALTGN
ncbi:MAG: hypothetical protein O3B72_11915, partial [Proteobacteria bacterium]|nr:hypothetical protein [Pseudomonadota bacterium]